MTSVDCREQAISLKFRIPSIQFPSEVFETDPKMSVMGDASSLGKIPNDTTDFPNSAVCPEMREFLAAFRKVIPSSSPLHRKEAYAHAPCSRKKIYEILLDDWENIDKRL